MKAIVQDDLVLGTASGDMAGPSVPADLASLPAYRLRFDGTAIIDAAAVTAWYVDADGQKHLAPAAGRQALTCAWNAAITGAAGTWRVLTSTEITAPKIQAEFDRRIAVAFVGKRNSLLSYAIALNGKVSIGLAAGQPIAQSLTTEELADVNLIWALDAWEGAMVTAREALIAAADATYADDAHWPPAPAGLTTAWLAGF